MIWRVDMSSVYVMLSCTFKYGREDMDVMGVAFRRDLFVVTRQVYPELQDKEQLTHTKVQQRLLQKLGNNAFPFFFEVRYLSSVRTLPRILKEYFNKYSDSDSDWPVNFVLVFQFPDSLPCSVALQPGPSDVGKVIASSSL